MDFIDEKNGGAEKEGNVLLVSELVGDRGSMEITQSDCRVPAFNHHARLSQILPVKEMFW